MAVEIVATAARVTADSWNQAIERAGDLLVGCGGCIPSYTTAMKNAIYEFGAYVVVAPGVAIPHARPEAGALRSALAVVTLAEPVRFGNPVNDPVDVVMAFTAVGDTTPLATISALLLDDHRMAAMRAARTGTDLSILVEEAASCVSQQCAG